MSELPYYSGISNSQNRYQPVQTSSRNERSQNQSPFIHTGDYPVQQKSDKEYFESLKHYRPLGYSGQGTPLLLVNDHWWASLGCIIFFDILFCVCVGIFVFMSNNSQINSKQNDSIFPAANKRSSSDTLVIILCCAICLVVINVSYFFCQFMNPGVVNMTNIKQEEFNQNGKKFCQHCYCYRTQDMHHCKECHICVWGLDHHCGFFNKCIAGWQKWAFYVFLTSLFCGFLLIIVCMGMALVFF